MVHVALVGGSTGFGRTLLQHLVDSKKHDITVFSRNEKPELVALGANVKSVDYNSHDSLMAALKGVHTVIRYSRLMSSPYKV